MTSFGISLLGLLSVSVCLLSGCTSGRTAGTSLSTTSPTAPVSTAPVSTAPGGVASVTGQNVYVVSDNPYPISALVFPTTATGATAVTTRVPGSQVSVDGAGNVYVLSQSGASIDEYGADALGGTPMRSLPVGKGAKIVSVVDVIADTAGEIYVSDGIGISVFGAAATGDVAPSRYISGITQMSDGSQRAIVPGVITVDTSGDVYVFNVADGSIDVFGPRDTGTVVASREVIYSPFTIVSGAPSYIQSMATDQAGALYVLCLCPKPEGSSYQLAVYEFSPSANGNVAPMRVYSDSTASPYVGNNGLAVDAGGTIYMSAGDDKGTPKLYEFSPSSSGLGAASNTLDSAYWLDAPPSRIAVH